MCGIVGVCRILKVFRVVYKCTHISRYSTAAADSNTLQFTNVYGRYVLMKVCALLMYTDLSHNYEQ